MTNALRLYLIESAVIACDDSDYDASLLSSRLIHLIDHVAEFINAEFLYL